MRSPNRILVPVDFTDPSRAALRYAAVLGAEVGASVDVLHVWHPPEDVDSKTGLLVEFARSDEGHKMIEWLAGVEKDSRLEAHGRLVPGGEGEVPDAILQEVQVGDYDLVVMGTHAHQGFWHQLLGGVTEEIVRRATCPVLTIRTDDHPAVAMVEAGASEGSISAQPS